MGATPVKEDYALASYFYCPPAGGFHCWAITISDMKTRNLNSTGTKTIKRWISFENINCGDCEGEIT